MPTKSRIEAGQRIAYLRWLWWATARRHPEYRRDVARLLQSLRKESAGQRRSTGVSITGRSFLLSPPAEPAASHRAAPEHSLSPPTGLESIPDPEPSLLFDSPTTIRPPDARFRRAQAVLDALNGYHALGRAIAHGTDLNTAYLSRGTVELPELATFEAKWGLRCPVPPRAERTPERLMCAPITRPVRIGSAGSSGLILDIWRPAGMAVLDHVAGILDQYQEHREPVLPPRWSLQQIKTAVRHEFGPSTLNSEDADEVAECQNRLALEAGYPSYVNLQRKVAQLDQQSASEDEKAATIEEAAAAMALLRKRGIPPRQARKGAEPGEVSIQERPEGSLRLTLTRPEAVDFGALKTTLKAHLTRGSLTVRVDDDSAHRRVLAVQDLLRKRRTTRQIAEKLMLYDSKSWGPDRVIELKRAYQDLIRRLHLPPLPSSR